MTGKRGIRIALITTAIVLGLCVLAAFDAAPRLFRAYSVGSASMEPTLLMGDCFFVEPFSAQGPARGDIVLLRSPMEPNATWVKRIAAMGGDRIRFRQKTFIRNGAPVAEPYVIHVTPYLDPFRDNFPTKPDVELPTNWVEELARNTVDGELVIPPGKFFVLGDNRDDSADSRYFGWLNREEIYGKVALIYYSADPKNRSFIRWNRIFRRF